MRLAISAALVCAFGLVGCGTSYTCKDLCTDTNKCSGATQENCDTSCADIDTSLKTSGCTSSWDSMLTCFGDHKDKVCVMMDGTDTSCQAETISLGVCILMYCNSHASDPLCTTY